MHRQFIVNSVYKLGVICCLVRSPALSVKYRYIGNKATLKSWRRVRVSKIGRCLFHISLSCTYYSFYIMKKDNIACIITSNVRMFYVLSLCAQQFAHTGSLGLSNHTIFLFSFGCFCVHAAAVVPNDFWAQNQCCLFMCNTSKWVHELVLFVSLSSAHKLGHTKTVTDLSMVVWCVCLSACVRRQ